MDSISWLLLLLGLALGALLGLVVGILATLRAHRRPGSAPTGPTGLGPAAAEPALIDGYRLHDSLQRIEEGLRDLEHQRVAWQARLHQQVDEVRHSTDRLSRETTTLSTALRRPQVRGRWGELHLRRSVELAGLVDHCDFETQVTHQSAEGWQRPDLVVHLPGETTVVIDAKVPLDAYLDATSTEDPADQTRHLAHHARQVRAHVQQLAGKAYWRAQPQTPQFVVLFLPAESFFSAALEADPALLEYAAANRVVIATPTTLIALLRTIAQGWTTRRLAERTREIHELGQELYERLGVAGDHLDRLGRSLGRSVEAFNAHVGSLESRVLVTARHFADIAELPDPEGGRNGVDPAGRRRDGPLTPVSVTPRPLTAPEFTGTGVASPGSATDDLP